MDDGKLANEMTLDDIGKRLETLQTEVRSGFTRVDEELNAAKIRDEKAHDLLKFSLETHEGLRESMATRFDEVERKQDEQIDLLKHAVRHLVAPPHRG